MDNRNFEQQWEEAKMKVKQAHPDIKDEELEYKPGNEEELLERLQAKLGKTKKEIRKWLHLMG